MTTNRKNITIELHHLQQSALINAIKFYQEELNRRENESHYPTNLYEHTNLTAVLHQIYTAQEKGK